MTKKRKIKQNLINYILVIILVFTSILLIFTIVSKMDDLDLNSKEIKTLYNLFYSEEKEDCGGLTIYNSEKVEESSLDASTKACLAYYETDDTEENMKLSAKKKSTVCKYEDMVFKTENDSKECTVKVLDLLKLKESYKKIFGKEIENITSFNINNKNICYIKDQKVYCGLSEKTIYSLTGDTTIYRVLSKAEKKGSSIEIYDYFLKADGSSCYTNYTTLVRDEKCSDKYQDKKNINTKFMYKYGTYYKHTYKLKNNEYHWVSSEPV